MRLDYRHNILLLKYYCLYSRSTQESRSHLKYLQENGLNERNYFHAGGADSGGGGGGGAGGFAETGLKVNPEGGSRKRKAFLFQGIFLIQGQRKRKRSALVDLKSKFLMEAGSLEPLRRKSH